MPNPYNLLENSYGFTFITDFGCEYTVYFIIADHYFSSNNTFNNNIYEFGFRKETGRKKNDPRVQDTITNVLIQFFNQNKEGVLIYNCDTSDQVEQARKNLFDQWYKEAEIENLVKLDESIWIKSKDSKYNKEILISIIFNNEHQFSNDIKKSFYDDFPNNPLFDK